MRDGSVMGVHPDDIMRIEWDTTHDGSRAQTLWLEPAPKSWHAYEGVRVLAMGGGRHNLVVKPEVGNGLLLQSVRSAYTPKEQS